MAAIVNGDHAVPIGGYRAAIFPLVSSAVFLIALSYSLPLEDYYTRYVKQLSSASTRNYARKRKSRLTDTKSTKASKTKHGQRTLVEIVDERASSEPDTVWATLCTSTDLNERQNVTYRDFSNAISRAAWRIGEKLKGKESGQTLYYEGPPDVRFFVFALAAGKVGHKALFISPRNTSTARLRLIESADCKIIFGAKNDIVEGVMNERSMEFFEFLSFEDCLKSDNVQFYEPTKSFGEARNDSFLILHTSGSTNYPKPMGITHGMLGVIDAFHDLPTTDGKDSIREQFRSGARIFSALPTFHSAGINLLAYSIFRNFTLVLGPSGSPPSFELVQNVLKLDLADAGYMPPSILEEFQNSESLDMLSSWYSVGFGGGPLKRDAGNAISQKTFVYNLFGSTETFHLPEIGSKTGEDWEYHAFHPLLGTEFRSKEDNLYEMVFVRNEENEPFQTAFHTFPDQNEFAMSDLYSKHPTKENHWLFSGRSDDLIMLSNGEKIQPNEVETLVGSREDVQSAMMVGNNRFSPAMIIEPATVDSFDGLKGAVEEIVALANERLPGHGQLDPQHIKILDKPDQLPRSAKGAVQRKKAVEQLESVIDELYDEEAGIEGGELDFSSEKSLLKSLKNLIETSNPKMKGLDPEDDMFQKGLDSLQVTRLAKICKGSFPSDDEEAKKSINSKLVYSNPTLEGLSSAMYNLSMGGHTGAKDPVTEMRECLSEATQNLPNATEARCTAERTEVCALLTGSTGSLGSHLLDTLMQADHIDRIICMNRKGGKNTKSRQQAQNRERGLSPNFHEHKVEFIDANLLDPNFGIPEEAYNRLLGRVTHIIHNAWPVNFNHAFSYFKPQVQICRNLIDFAALSKHCPETFFMSSVGAGNGWLHKFESPVPEEPITDLGVADPMGYAQSKLVSERVFDIANRRAYLPTTICRVGQIAGPVTHEEGEWSRNEWFPSLMASSAKLGKLPENLAGMDGIDWVPIDLLAQAVVQLLSLKPPVERSRVLNFVNPNRTSWAELLPVAEKMLRNPEVVSYEEWLEALRKSQEDEEGVDENPAIKLLDFYESLPVVERPVFTTDQCTKSSKTMAEMSPVKKEWLELWCWQWGFGENGRKKGNEIRDG